ncbi:MAG: hypothetical protein J0L71_08590, partial [Candidatus Accumulibacter sp.]|uniref:hypothetical protein n=1 Tax=Accumulibacter sp. TaxID=2053492 RepID=UPI001ACA6AEB
KQRAATSRFPRHVKSFLYFFEKFLRRRNVFGIRWRLRVSKLQSSSYSLCDRALDMWLNSLYFNRLRNVAK